MPSLPSLVYHKLGGGLVEANARLMPKELLTYVHRRNAIRTSDDAFNRASAHASSLRCSGDGYCGRSNLQKRLAPSLLAMMRLTLPISLVRPLPLPYQVAAAQYRFLNRTEVGSSCTYDIKPQFLFNQGHLHLGCWSEVIVRHT
jgi:hypothetical protein